MAKIKHTKTELKAQREALRRFERFLPMLILKKQQLQMEIQNITARILQARQAEQAAADGMQAWVRLLAEPVNLESLVRVQSFDMAEGNIAGVAIPLLKAVHIEPVTINMFTTPPWIDDAVETLTRRIELRAQREVLEEQRRRVEEELRTTSQRVNLFEKVKIPECRENIRVIRIFLGDEQTASVARGKIAKQRAVAA
ncbi:MAG: V-type ATP synthase subunit D [Lentisphaerae bacterium RIFOXYC12_FULL_60_16]|nr:MAG: V-type ATP synthase subunit D [Lentisphaerae bacterium RIFOXYC12_FULL_60_16]OGV84985.1 MAG: V-type ATP synthase subunit D [Lentisphaerae bacterium RIFOXYB12_FULL_60_10]